MIWASNYSARLKRLIVLQNRALRIIVNQARHSSTHLPTDLAFQDTHILKLERIAIQQTSEFMHKYTNNQLPSSFNNIITSNLRLNLIPILYVLQPIIDPYTPALIPVGSQLKVQVSRN